MSEPIAIIPKNSMDEIRVTWSEYKGHRYLDIRVYTEIEGKADKAPTKKGVTLRPDMIPARWSRHWTARRPRKTRPSRIPPA